MDHPNKRVLTEGARETSAATNAFALTTGVTEDLALRLRNVGPRVRHSVSQGYQTAPSHPRSFVKSQSMGSIFCSMNDTLCDVRKELSVAEAHAYQSSRKRSHCAEQSINLDPNMHINVDEAVNTEEPSGEPSTRGLPSSLDSRPTKNLPSMNRTFRQARSLPTWSPPLSQQQATEEEDWSCDMILVPQTSEQQSEPACL